MITKRKNIVSTIVLLVSTSAAHAADQFELVSLENLERLAHQGRLLVNTITQKKEAWRKNHRCCGLKEDQAKCLSITCTSVAYGLLCFKTQIVNFLLPPQNFFDDAGPFRMIGCGCLGLLGIIPYHCIEECFIAPEELTQTETDELAAIKRQIIEKRTEAKATRDAQVRKDDALLEQWRREKLEKLKRKTKPN